MYNSFHASSPANPIHPANPASPLYAGNHKTCTTAASDTSSIKISGKDAMLTVGLGVGLFVVFIVVTFFIIDKMSRKKR